MCSDATGARLEAADACAARSEGRGRHTVSTLLVNESAVPVPRAASKHSRALKTYSRLSRALSRATAGPVVAVNVR
ncbi:unnamed protein product [Colias eurytheme]|nr:unnamed protein product [Colias eurytheme]